MKICNWLLISLFLILCLNPLSAQYTYHTSDSSLIYTEQVKGLEDIYDRKVGKSFCDSNQTIWLASQGGLFRFDGSFPERVDIPLDFSADYIWLDLFEDEWGDIWFHARNIIDGQHKLFCIKQFSEIAPVVEDCSEYLSLKSTLGENYRIVKGVEKGLLLIDENGGIEQLFRSSRIGKLEKSNIATLDRYQEVKKITSSREGLLIQNTDGDVILYDIKQNRRFTIAHKEQDQNLFLFENNIDRFIKVVLVDKNRGKLTFESLDYFPSTGRVEELNWTSNSYRKDNQFDGRIFYDQFNDDLIIISRSRVSNQSTWLFQNKEFNEIVNRIYTNQNFSDLNVIDENTIGVASKNGYLVCKRKEILFHNINIENNLGSLVNSIRRFVKIDEKHLYLQAYGGSIIIDAGTLEKVTDHPFIDYMTQELNIPLGGYSQFFELGKDHLLLPSKKEGIVILDKNTLRYQVYKSSGSEKIGQEEIWSIFYQEDAELVYIFGTENDYLIDLKLGQYSFLTNDFYGDFGLLNGQLIYQTLPLNDHELILATSIGLFKLDLKLNRIVEKYNIGNSEGKVNNESVHYVHQISPDEFYLGTNSAGVIKFSLKDGLLNQYTMLNNEPILGVHYIFETVDGGLFLATNNKLLLLNPETGTGRSFFVNDGVLFNEFNRQAYYYEAGRLFLGGVSGAVQFNPNLKKFANQYDNLKVRIIGAEWFNPTTVQYEPLEGDQLMKGVLKLSPSQRNLRLKLSTNLYGAGIGNYYYANGNSISSDEFSGDRNLIKIDNIEYGTDTLYVRAEFDGGSISTSKLAIPYNLPKPFFKRSIFFAIIGVSIVGLIYMFSVYRERSAEQARLALEDIVVKRTEENKRQAEELLELTKLKDKFFINISHELKTPLSLVQGPLEKLESSKSIPEDERLLLQMASNNIVNLSNLIKEILDLSKLELGKQEIDLVALELESFVKSRLDQFSLKASSNQVDLEFISSGHEIKGMFDKKMVHTIVSNIIDNSLKHATGLTALIVQIIKKDNKVEILFKDNGSGIPADKLRYIFNRFHTIPDDKGGASLGIGMAISREFADLMGGELTVESKVAVGTTFKLILPIHEKKYQHVEFFDLETEENTAKQMPDSNTVQAEILVVEDNIQLAKFVELLLKDKYNVVLKYNGQEAWDYLNEPDVKLPELIISDIMMPKMDGFELLEKVKEDPKLSIPSFLFLTARDNKDDILRAMRIGVEDYLTKPFAEAELLRVVSQLISNYRVRINSRKEYEEELKKTLVETVGGDQPGSELPTIQLSEGLPLADKEFLESFDKLIEENISKLEFTIEDLSYSLAISSRQLRRKIQKLSGLTPNQYIRKYKMNVARELLESRSIYSVKELSYKLGFKSSAHFAKLFKNHFGRNPSDFV